MTPTDPPPDLAPPDEPGLSAGAGTPASTRPATRRFWPVVLVALLLLACVAVLLAERAGWPFLAGPLERIASRMLDRQVLMRADATPGRWQLRLLGGLGLTAPRLVIAAPAWSAAPHLVSAQEVQLDLRYGDLWRAWNGGALQIRRLQAASLDAWIERRSDGRASWQLGTAPAVGAAPDAQLPVFESVQLSEAHVKVQDALQLIDITAEMSLRAGARSADPAAPTAAVDTMTPPPAHGLQVQAKGSFRRLPLQMSLKADGSMPWLVTSRQANAMPLAIQLAIGQARLEFQGTAQGIWPLHAVNGRFRLSGPSLADVGDPLGMALPTTPAFHSEGRVIQQGLAWRVALDDATVGSSRLNGDLSYDTGLAVPLLSGRLGGSRLMLSDLAPVVGVEPAEHAPTGRAGPVSRRKVLPDRPFDLASLRLMDANLLVAIDEVDLNHARLRPLRPFKAHLQLSAAQLRLTDLDARTGQGRLRGQALLDGHGHAALVQAQVAWDGVHLEQWIAQPRAHGAQPFITGKLLGRADLKGQGRSTAEILASLSGQVHTEVHDGTVSQLAVEAAGIDVAQVLGALIRGDKALPISCAVASLVAERGVLRPQVLVVDTPDSTVWVDGSLSLADETMDLRATVTPRDFSPLALRAPLRVHGPLAAPIVSLDGKVIGRKVVTAAALAFVNPLAALIPLVDPGNAEQARQAANSCELLVQRAHAHTAGSPARAGTAPLPGRR